MTKRALITGITGQIGSYLAELLLEKGYEVHGLVRRSSNFSTQRIDHIFDRLHLHYGDLADSSALHALLASTTPHEVYNLAAQSHVKVSFDAPEYTSDVTGVGVTRLLEAVRNMLAGRGTRFYQASSSEMFGNSPAPQNETTPFDPRSPYAVAKVYGYYMAKHYREAYSMYVVNGICFNAESERRGETFVTRKITRALTRIKLGLQNRLVLGNLDARRDWGYAGDYAEAMWLLLQQPEPSDYVIGTGESHSVRSFLINAAAKVGLSMSEPWLDFYNERYLRPTEVNHLWADASKLRSLGWAPKVPFDELIDRMIKRDFSLASAEKLMANLK